MLGLPVGIAILSGSVTLAQDVELQQHVTDSVAWLAQLDALAGTCNVSLQQPADAVAAAATQTVNLTPCSQFLAAIDGELLTQYLAHCSALKEWKSHYVTSTFEADQTSTTPETALQLLVGTDYACGENALQQRTQFVTSTFALIQRGGVSREVNGAGISQRPGNQLDQRLKELQFDSTLTAERNLLQKSVQQQEQQRALESARQMRQIELENLRQQLNQ